MALQIMADNTLVVKVPWFLPKWEIDKFLDKYSGWIEKRLGQTKLKKRALRSYIEGEKFLYLGETIHLKISNYQEIKTNGGQLLLPNHLVFRAKKEIEGWYLKQSKQVINELLEDYSKRLKTSYKSLRFSDTSSKWGSCTHDNKLQFNWRLIMAPILVIRYVVIHELAHTLEKNHSRKFWSIVASINPSYKQQIRWLKINGHHLNLQYKIG
jgi:predicted metal-dependent hydrolase